MRKIIFLASFICSSLFLSCSSDDSEPVQPVACFEISKNEIIVGEEVQVSDCSENATELVFSYKINGEDITTSVSQFSIEFSIPGEYQITLRASNAEGGVHTIFKNITVLNGESNFKYFDYPLGINAIPLGSGIDTDTQTLYFIEDNRNFSGQTSEQKLIYREIDLDNTIKQSLFVGSTEGSRFSGHCIRTKNSSNQLTFDLIRSDINSSLSFTIAENGTFVSEGFTSLKATHGNIDFNNGKAFYGANFEFIDSTKKFSPVIEIRDANNTVTKTNTYTVNLPNAIIGDVIETSHGYLGYGASFEHNNNDLTLYTPVLYFFDTNLDLVDYKTYENSPQRSFDIPLFYLSSWFHIEELNSGNIVLYGLDEMIVTNSEGVELKSEKFGDLSYAEGLVNLGDSFIISTPDFLRKFDSSGNEIKNVFFDGDYTPNLFLKDNTIFFISAYNTTDTIENLGNLSIRKTFMGAVDKDLNFVDLNN